MPYRATLPVRSKRGAVHDDTSRIGGVFSGRAGRGGSGCVEQGRCTRFLYQMHVGHQLHEHNWDFLLWTRCLWGAPNQEALLHSCGRGICRCEPELRSYAKQRSCIQIGDDGVLRTRLLLVLAKEHEGSPRFTMSPWRHYLFEGNYTGGCEVPRHGTGTASNSEVAFCSIWNRNSH
jgi:hypothetical protein